MKIAQFILVTIRFIALFIEVFLMVLVQSLSTGSNLVKISELNKIEC